MTLITKQGFCPACMMTQRFLNAHHVKYTVKHLKTSQERMRIKSYGFKQYPVVEPNDDLSNAFSGFHPEILRKLIK